MSTPELEAAAVDALAAEGAAARSASAGDGGAHETCPNCGTARTGLFCARCGQKAAPLAPTLGYFLREAAHELLNVDGKIFRSVRLLLARPGYLTREIFRGRRASYVAPLRLYLLASVLAFAFAAVFGGFDAVNLEYTPSAGETFDAGRAERTAAAERTVTEAINVWLPRAMFVLVPLFAALVMLFRRGSGYTYPQHLYFALHVHAAWFLANALDSLSESIRLPYVASSVDLVTELYMVAYFPVAFWRVYGTTVFGAVWRALSIGVLYFLALLLTFVSIAAPTVWPLIFGEPS